MTRAFVDTTVLTDRLLKPGPRQDKARAALARYGDTLLPVYAIKEFRQGPLMYFRLVHNKLVEKESVPEMLEVIRNWIGPKTNLPRTALEAIEVAWGLVPSDDVARLREKYGDNANPDKIKFDALKGQLKSLIYRAWKQRRTVTTVVVDELECFLETPPIEKRKMLELPPPACVVRDECALAQRLKADMSSLESLREANNIMPQNSEKERRGRALRRLTRTPTQDFDEKHCRNLGDAVFAFFAPADTDILTTNAKDHRPLAAALGKTVSTP